MFQSIGPQSSVCRQEKGRLVCDELPEHHTIEVRSYDRDSLLVDFLSEALYLSDVHNQAYLDARIIQLTDTYIKVTIKGIEVTGFEVVEIKAVTHHELAIEQKDGLWQATIVFDI